MRVKSIFSKIIIAFFLGLCLSIGFHPDNTIASVFQIAEAYPEYLNGDKDYICCDGHMGTAFYVVASSLNVEKYDPPQYIIAVDVASARSAIDDENDFYRNGGAGKITDVRRHRFFYNWDLRRMYVDSHGNDDWRYLDPKGDWAHTGIVMPAGQVAFLLAYDTEFYSRYNHLADLVRNR
ncbi:MAG: hypothetical protein IIY37_01375 [Selenomonadaceae bacterium]|nr:hypothetical protein [Selenomonadaceae bacterium]MBQ1510082.1 hypothetical protein [Selenomonadaceae bacterium]